MMLFLLLAGVALACEPLEKIDPKEEYYIKIGKKGTKFSKFEGEGKYLALTESNNDEIVRIKFTNEWTDTTTKFKIQMFENKVDSEKQNASNDKKQNAIMIVTGDYALTMNRDEKVARPEDNKSKQKQYEISFQRRENETPDKYELFTYESEKVNAKKDDEEKADEEKDDKEKADDKKVKGGEDVYILNHTDTYWRVKPDEAPSGSYVWNGYDYVLQKFAAKTPPKKSFTSSLDTKPVQMKNALKNQTGLYTDIDGTGLLIDTYFCFMKTGGKSEALHLVKEDLNVYTDELKKVLDIADFKDMDSTEAYKIFQKKAKDKFQDLVLKQIRAAPDNVEGLLGNLVATAWSNYFSPEKQNQEKSEKKPNLKTTDGARQNESLGYEQQYKDNSDKKETVNNLSQIEGANLVTSVDGKNSSTQKQTMGGSHAVKYTILTVLASLIIQY